MRDYGACYVCEKPFRTKDEYREVETAKYDKLIPIVANELRPEIKHSVPCCATIRLCSTLQVYCFWHTLSYLGRL